MRILLICTFFSLIGCTAAHRQSPSEESDPSVAGETALPLDTAGAFYVHLEGTVGAYPIRMELMRVPDRYVDGGYDGYYYYEQYGEPLTLYGTDEEPGTINLYEQDVEGNTTGRFRGRLGADGRFEGNWISGDEKRTLPFTLQAAAPGSVLAFDLTAFADSLLVPTGAQEAPRIYVRQRWLYPNAPNDPQLTDFLRAEISKYMVGDSLAAIYTDPAAAFHADKLGYYDGFREEIRSLQEYQKENPDDEGWLMNHEYTRDMEIFYLSPTLLTVGFTDYAYSGGAHGYYGTGVVSYDLKARKEIRLEDVFKPGYEEAVRRVLEAKARQAYGLNPKQPLSELFLVDEITPTENFGLTDKGVFFIYNPYEIAAYAFGQVTLFVPFAEIKEWRK